MPDDRVIAIFGPTASGKSAVARALADLVGGELVSADSMQAYRGVPILTNQDDPPPRLVAIWPLTHDGSVGEYQRLAHQAIDEIAERGRVPIVVGGTGLYLRAALSDLDLPPAPAPGARERWERLYDEEGAARAHALLTARDPAAAAAVHANDRRRVVRALELAETGHSLAGDRLWGGDHRRATLVFGLDLPADRLEARIVARARAMFDAGVEGEARAALAASPSPTARKILGLDEVATLPREQALEALVIRTRRYAAYQRKWMRRIPNLIPIDATGAPDETARAIAALAASEKITP